MSGNNSEPLSEVTQKLVLAFFPCTGSVRRFGSGDPSHQLAEEEAEHLLQIPDRGDLLAAMKRHRKPLRRDLLVVQIS